MKVCVGDAWWRLPHVKKALQAEIKRICGMTQLEKKKEAEEMLVAG